MTTASSGPAASAENTRSPIPATAGIGLRPLHMPEVANALSTAAPKVAWWEVHSENFLGPGGPRLAMMDDIARHYPMSCHGVGLSLGSADGLDASHLARLKTLFTRIRPALVSEHLSWSVIDGTYLNDLLPLPYTAESLDVVARNVDRAQQVFGWQILVENPSAYVSFESSVIPEWEFLAHLCARTGCGLLLDVNNVYVSAINNGSDPSTYISNIDGALVGEFHLAGHSVEDEGDAQVLVDTHSRLVCDPVWDLFRATVARIGARPTLIEWDLELPPMTTLIDEAARADAILSAQRGSDVRAA